MRVLALTAFVLLAACSSKTLVPAGGGLMSLFSGPALKLREYRVQQLPNGMKIYFVRDDSLPRVSLQLLVKVGQRDEPADLVGINSVVASLLDQGTTTKSAGQLAEAFNALGTEFGASPSDDLSFYSASTVTPEASKLLDLFVDVMTRPAFSEKELGRTRAQYLAAIRRRMDNPSGFAGLQYEKFLFGAHPYGRDSLGDEKSLKRIKRADLLRYYLAWYRPNNAIMAVTGRYDADFEKKVADAFSKWGRRKVKDVESPKLAQIGGTSMRLVSKPGLVQTQIRMGRMGIERANPDDFKLRLANEALGGGFGSRLMQKIRDDLGLTYSISSGFDAREKGGSFTISTFTKNETAGRTIEEIFKVYREYVEKGITQAELDTAKAQLIGQYPRSLETADAMAGQLLMIDFYKLPIAYLTDFPKLIERISLTEVNEAIRKHLGDGSLRVLVYGDKRAVAGQLKAWNPEIVDVR